MSSDRRLHPVSLVLYLGRVFKDFIIPALLVLFAARSSGQSWEAWLGFLLIPYAGLAIGRYLTFRFRYEPEELVVRSGILFRSIRHVPYARIQNLDARQNLIHRLFGVAEVRVETGAGIEPEAVLSVLPLAEVLEMRRRVFGQRKDAVPAADAGEVLPAKGRVLLHLPARELMLAGLIENRGLVLILAMFGVAWESGLLNRLLGALGLEGWGEGVAREVWGALSGVGGIPLSRIGFMAAVLIGVLLALRLISMVWAVIRLHDFRLILEGEDLRTEYGLFTRVTETIPLGRIQAVGMREGLLHRPFGRAAVRVATAGGTGFEKGSKPREWLAPIIRRERVEMLLREILPGFELSQAAWQAAHPRAAGRVFRRWLIGALLLSLPAIPVLGWRALAVFTAVTLWGIPAARLYVRNLGWALTEDGVLFKSGWVSRYLALARLNRIQVVALFESPFDRRTGMAGVSVDTAGAAEAFALDIPYLSSATARALYDRLAAEAAGTEFKW